MSVRILIYKYDTIDKRDFIAIWYVNLVSKTREASIIRLDQWPLLLT